jgi:transcriptional regulator with XRE-family HTH domain
MQDVQNPLSKIVPAHRLRCPHPLKQKIRSLGLRQVDIAAALGCSNSELSRWLNDGKAMPASIEERIVNILSAVEAGTKEEC